MDRQTGRCFFKSVCLLVTIFLSDHILFEHTCSKRVLEFCSCSDKNKNFRCLVQVLHLVVISASEMLSFYYLNFSITSRVMFLPSSVVVGLFINGSANIAL